MAQRYAELRARLRDHGFDASMPMDGAVASLASDLLDTLIVVKDDVKKMRVTADRASARLLAAEQVAPPLRAELAQAKRENMALHAQLIAMSDSAAATPPVEESHVLRDLKFVSTSLRQRCRALEAENAALREAASRSYEANGVVLPSGHEVRWHGWKERMEAHTPVGPLASEPVSAAADAPTAVAGEPQQLVPAEQPVRLIRAAETQLSAMLGRIDTLEGEVAALQTQLAAVTAQRDARDEQLTHVTSQLVAAVGHGGPPPAPAAAGGVSSRLPPSLAGGDGAPAAIGQLNSQVDFLNERCVRLEAAVEAEAAAAAQAHAALREASRRLAAQDELVADRARLQEELRYAAAAAKALGHNLGA